MALFYVFFQSVEAPVVTGIVLFRLFKEELAIVELLVVRIPVVSGDPCRIGLEGSFPSDEGGAELFSDFRFVVVEVVEFGRVLAEIEE